MDNLNTIAIREEYSQKLTIVKEAYIKGDLETAATLIKETCDFGLEFYKEEKITIDILRQAQLACESKPQSPCRDRELQIIKGAYTERKKDNSELIECIMQLDQGYDSIMKRITTQS